MQPTIMRFVWKFSKREQLIAIALTLVSFPLLYLMLELPKLIINDAISNVSESRLFFGLNLGPYAYLFTLSGCLLVLVIINGLFKMRINTYKGIIGERLVRRLRYALVDRVLRFPLARFQRVSQGEIIATVIPETEPLAEFCGNSIALPVFQGGTLLTILIFMFMQNPWLGLASIALIPLQLYIIPRLQRKVNELKKQRVKRVRVLSERLGETISGAREVRVQGTRRYTLAEFSYRLGELFKIRLEIFRTKFLMKFLNNTIGQLTPFLFYALGGFLVIRGELSLGALVAALAAYKDILGPWKELLNQYQRHQDATVKYAQIIEQFDPPGLAASRLESLVVIDNQQPVVLALERVAHFSEQGNRIFSGVSLELQPGSSIEVVAENTAHRNAFAQIAGGLIEPIAGNVTLNGIARNDLSERDFHSRVAYIGPDPFIFNSAISYNFGYALNHQPPSLEERSEAELADLAEAVLSGNSADWFDESFGTVWTDYSLLGKDNWPEGLQIMMQVLHVVGVEDIVARGSLGEFFSPAEIDEKMSRENFETELLAARVETQKRIQSQQLSHLISPFDPEAINPWSSIAENILFGVVTNEEYSYQRLAESEVFRGSLRETGFYDRAVALGDAASRALLRFKDNLPPNHELVIQFGLDNDDTVEKMSRAVDTLDSKAARLTEKRREKIEAAEITLLSVFLAIEPGSFNLIEIPQDTSAAILTLREHAREYAMAENAEMLQLFDTQAYSSGLSVFDNLIFGRINHHIEGAQKQLMDLVEDVVRDHGLREFLIIVFFVNSQSGVGGSRLPEAARHRINLGRTLIKHPKVLILHDALPRHSDELFATTMQRIREYLPDVALLNVTSSPSVGAGFDTRYVLDERGFTQGAAGASELAHAGQAEVESERGESGSSQDTLLGVIESINMLSALTHTQMEVLALDSARATAKAEQVIYEVGDEPSHVYVLMKGSVVLKRPVDGVDTEVLRFDNRALIGEIEVLADHRRKTTLVALSDCEFVKLKGATVRRLIEENAQLSRDILLDLANKVVLAT